MTVVIVADDSIWQEPPMFKNKKSWLKNWEQQKRRNTLWRNKLNAIQSTLVSFHTLTHAATTHSNEWLGPVDK